MPGMSSFLSEDGERPFRGEFRFYIVYGLILCVCGLELLSVAVTHGAEITLFIASWLLFIAALLSMLRSVLYYRGFADIVMGILTASFYGFIGWAAGSAGFAGLNGYRILLCILLALSGLSRLLSFARLSTSSVMPLMAVLGAADLAGSVFLLGGYQDGAVSVWWTPGMLLLIAGIESMVESERLSHFMRKLRSADEEEW